MQPFAIIILALALTTGAALAQTSGSPLVLSTPSGTDVPADARKSASKQSVHDAAVANCEGMWDRGTHMTKIEWSRTCRRVQNRLYQFDLK